MACVKLHASKMTQLVALFRSIQNQLATLNSGIVLKTPNRVAEVTTGSKLM